MSLRNVLTTNVARVGLATAAGLALGWSILAVPTVGRQATVPLPAEKQAILDRYADLVAQGAAHAARIGSTNPVDAVPPAAPMVPLPGVAVGIGRLNADADTVGPPGIPGQFTNSWYVIGPPVTAIVWAGVSSDDPSQGIIVVSLWNDPQATSLQSTQVIKAPRQSGTLRIESATDYVLKLRAADGSKLVFDVRKSGFGR
ncbi:MAG TPA: hypothetical protein VNF73_12470 [Candidatus Saccharimonadales bacterium]|nr:hypothetical protein [Candidatus Saccharimonadales bacterium]